MEIILTLFLGLFCLGIIWVLFEDFIFPLLKLFVFTPIVGVVGLTKKASPPKLIPQNEKPNFWLGSTKVKTINGVSMVSFITLFMSVLEWEFLFAFLLAAIITISLDVFLYSKYPELFE